MSASSPTTKNRTPRDRRLTTVLKTVVAPLVLSIALVGVGTQTASALSKKFTEYMPASNTLYWFSTVYNHSTPGPINIKTTDIPSCGESTRVGLWSPQTGDQFTNSLVFTEEINDKNFVNSASGSTHIGSVGFSMDARRGGACNPNSSTDPLVKFEGTLTY